MCCGAHTEVAGRELGGGLLPQMESPVLQHYAKYLAEMEVFSLHSSIS